MWDSVTVQPLDENDSEIKQKDTFVGMSSIKTSELDTTKYSSWNKVVRVYSWMKRFCHNLKAKLQKDDKTLRKGPLLVEELLSTETWIFREIQRIEFHEEYSDLMEGKAISRRSKILQLSPYMDNDGITRIGGRLRRAELSSMKKHQIILPGQHHLVKLLVKYYHNKTHRGTEYVLSELRQTYWITSARSAIKKIARNCLHCRKLNAKPITPYMCDLPSYRLDYKESPFTHTGVDFFGPLYIKQRRSRLKRWGSLFVCMVTRAIHLELVESMETDSFINTLQRFINRRGRPKTILSDCGSNFKGTVAELKPHLTELNQGKISNFTSNQNIQWKFNPPSSPHMGGSWERLVQTVKRSLFNIIKDRVLTDFQMITVFTEVEVVVNNRPLTANSDDIEDLEVLTPNHFLIGRNFSNNSHLGDIRSNDVCSRKRWRQVQYISEQFWKRCLREYLPTLTRRTKWTTQAKPLRVGDLVMLQEDNTKRGSWPLGRIENVYPGSDGVIRIVDVRTKTGVYKRPAMKIYPLEDRFLMRFLKVEGMLNKLNKVDI